MTGKEVIQKLMRIDGITYEEMATRLNYSSRDIIYKTINNNDGMNMKLKTFINWLEQLGAQVVIQTFSSDDEYILDGEEES